MTHDMGFYVIDYTIRLLCPLSMTDQLTKYLQVQNASTYTYLRIEIVNTYFE